MATIVRLPKLGLSDRGEIVEWTVSPDSEVHSGDVIAVLESDKSAVDIEAPTDGVLLVKYVEEGEEIDIEPGRPIAAIGEDGEPAPVLEADGNTSSQQDQEETDESPTETTRPPALEGDLRVTPKARVAATEHDIDLSAVPATGPEGSVTSGDVEQFVANSMVDSTDHDHNSPPASGIKATPKAKRFASTRSVDLTNVTGTGPVGAVTERDVQRHLEGDTTEPRSEPNSPSAVASRAQTIPVDTEHYTITEVRKRSRVQQTAAERLSRSIQEKPHVRGNRTVNIEALDRVATDLKMSTDLSPSVNDLLFSAIVLTLRAHPEFNAVYTDDEYRLVEERNVGYAVGTEEGLLVPVVKDANRKSLDELTEARRSAVEHALDGTYEPSDLRGGTFTVTNVGALGMDSAFSIINPPEVAIMVVGRRKPELFEEDDEIVQAMGVQLSLLIDHRVLDGADAGQFLTTLTDYIEHPARILSEK